MHPANKSSRQFSCAPELATLLRRSPCSCSSLKNARVADCESPRPIGSSGPNQNFRSEDAARLRPTSGRYLRKEMVAPRLTCRLDNRRATHLLRKQTLVLGYPAFGIEHSRRAQRCGGEADSSTSDRLMLAIGQDHFVRTRASSRFVRSQGPIPCRRTAPFHLTGRTTFESGTSSARCRSKQLTFGLALPSGQPASSGKNNRHRFVFVQFDDVPVPQHSMGTRCPTA